MANLKAVNQKDVGRNSHDPRINDFNLQMRSQPWYQDWFRQQGLDPNKVKLSGGQRQQLQQLIVQKGGVPASAFDDMKIDPAGNLNTEHGFASQPTWLKALEIGGAATAGAFAMPGSIGSLVGMSGPTPTVAGSTVAAPAAAGGVTPAITAAGASPVVAKKSALSKLGSLFGGENKMGNLLTSGGLGFLESALSRGPQERKSYSGTSADPVKMLTESNDRTRALYDQLLPRLNQKLPNVTPEAPTGGSMRGGLPAGIGINNVQLKQRQAPGMFEPEDPMAHMMENLGLLGVKL